MIFGGKYAHCFEKKKWRKIKKCRSIFFTLFMGISRIEQTSYLYATFSFGPLNAFCCLVMGERWLFRLWD